MKRSVPEPWATAMQRRGFTGPDNQASLTAMHNAGGPAVETIRRLVWGIGTPSEETIGRVAEMLAMKPTEVRRWARQAAGVDEPFELPAKANQLGKKQRRAVLAVVDALLEAQLAHADLVREHEQAEAEVGDFYGLATQSGYAPAAQERTDEEIARMRAEDLDPDENQDPEAQSDVP